MAESYVFKKNLRSYNPEVKHSSELYIENVDQFIKKRKISSFKGKQLVTEAYNLEYLDRAISFYCYEFKDKLPAEVGLITVPHIYNIEIDNYRDNILISTEFIDGHNFEIFLKNMIKSKEVNDEEINNLLKYIKVAWIFHNISRDLTYAHRDYYPRHLISSSMYYYVVDHEVGLINLFNYKEIEEYFEKYYEKEWNRLNSTIFRYIDQLNISIRRKIKNKIKNIKREYIWEINKNLLEDIRRESVNKTTLLFEELGIGKPRIIWDKKVKRYYITFF